MLTLDNISFSYGQKKVLKDFSLSLNAGELLAVMGPSGCGKTTVLRIIAGLIQPENGTVRNNFSKISMVFQESRLFPWLTVYDNILAVLPKKTDCKSKIYEILEAVGLSDCAGMFPSELSGGMKSRASLARALAYDGDLYLLDEPFAALDEKLRSELTVLLKEKMQEKDAAAILVTHLAKEARQFADRIYTFAEPTE